MTTPKLIVAERERTAEAYVVDRFSEHDGSADANFESFKAGFDHALAFLAEGELKLLREFIERGQINSALAILEGIPK